MTDIAPPPVPPVVLPEQRHLVVPRIGRERAEPRILSEIYDGALRPPDAREASSIEAPRAMFVPFWRVDVRRLDEQTRLQEERIGYLGVPVSHEGADDPHAAWMVCAVSGFPYEMRHPASPIPGDSKPLALHLGYVQPGDPDPAWGWEVLDADIDVATARALAVNSFRKFAIDPGVLLGDTEIHVRAIHFVRYPVWFARYRYGGQNAPTRDGLFHVGISALDEAPITAVHPSKLAAGAAKIKKLFGIRG